MISAAAVLLATLFGGADQYLGSLSMHPWAADISLLSAPWLLLPFLAGYTQKDPRRAMLLGFVCTYAALIGYGFMTLSPVENAHMTVASVLAFIRSEHLVIAGGVLTGPLFGWFGYRWSAKRTWAGAIATAGAFCLEPVARILAGRAIGSSTVLIAEVALGIAMVGYVVLRWRPAGP